MATGLGEFLKNLRRTRQEKLLDMANTLNFTPAFLSAIEHGKKKPPNDLLRKITFAYSLTENQVNKLQTEIDRANSGVRISAKTPLARETAAVFARKANDLSETKLNKIRKILDES